MKSIIRPLSNSNLHAILSTLLIINLHGVIKIYFAVLEEIYKNVGKQFLSLAIIELQASSLLQKTVQIRDKFFLYMDPDLNS
jgi:hypothetical protein